VSPFATNLRLLTADMSTEERRVFLKTVGMSANQALRFTRGELPLPGMLLRIIQYFEVPLEAMDEVLPTHVLARARATAAHRNSVHRKAIG
jgi:hypothetical protein